MIRRLRHWWWLGLVAFALVTLVTGLLLEGMVRRELEADLASELTTIRDLNVAALREWLDAVKHVGSSTATDAVVRKDALALFDAAARTPSTKDLVALPEQAPLATRLDITLRQWRLAGYVFVAGGRTVGASDPSLVGVPVPDSDIPQRAFRGETVIDLPHRPTVDALKVQTAIMFVISPIKADDGTIRGFLALRVEPEKTFTRLLGTARFRDSGETYAFQKDALLLSQSRFEDDLRAAGRLSEGESSVLAVSVREPGADKADRAGGQLTRAAAAATRGETGFDVTGYRDYRGTDVVGAWRWLEDYEFAVLTELDREEAYRSSGVIRQASRGLTVVIFACALVIGGVSMAMRRLDRRVERAERLGQYTLDRKIGEGGMGAVYLARHALLRRPTAIKVLKGEANDPVQARFEREVQAMASLAHPNTVAVYDYGKTSKGTFYYAMELLDGWSLEDLVTATGPMSQARAIHVLLQMLGSLGEAHDAGLVHRDVKPANVMLCRRGGLADFVKVVDFGLVKHFSGKEDTQLTQANTVIGTPLYMAPECMKAPETVDHRSDLYAVAAVAYFLLVGRPVFEADSLVAIFSKHMIQEPTPLSEVVPGVSPELEALVLKGLAKEPADRPASAREMIERLEAIREAAGVRWSQHEANAWWDEHPTKTPSGSGGVSISAEIDVDLEGRSSPRRDGA